MIYYSVKTIITNKDNKNIDLDILILHIRF